MKKILLLLAMLLVLMQAEAQKAKEKPDQRFAGLDAQLQALLGDWRAAGFAVAVVEKDKIVYTRGFGYKDYAAKTPVTPNTLFAIGSCTKAFTSSLLGILADEKKIDLDKSPRYYLPELKFYNDDMDNLITIRDMMCHRTGLPRHDASWYFFPSDSKDSLTRRIQFMEPSAGIRQRYQYNNFMFMLQGNIVEKVSGRSWEANVAEKIFKPLGMTRSNFTIDELKKSDDRSLGYGLKDNTEIELQDYYQIRGLGAAGSINSSVTEMSNWVITWINGGKFGDKNILPASYVSQAISSQMVASAGLPSKEHPDIQMATYGFAWALSSYRGHYRVQHGGNIDGFSALTCFYPTDSIGIVILVNQNSSTLPGVVRNIITDRMLSLPVYDWNKESLAERDKTIKNQKEAAAKTALSKKTGTSMSHKLSEYAGNFVHPGYGNIRIVVQNDSLFAVFPLQKLWLKHYHYDIFQPFEYEKGGVDTTQSSEQRINFRTNDQGEIESLHFPAEPALKPMEFRRKLDPVPVTKEELAKYPGDYDLAGMIAKFYIKNENTLYLLVPGQPEYELQALGNNLFALKQLEGYRVEFITDGNKNVKSAIFIQPNGRFEAIRK